jgi:hypothetical protein
MENYSFKNDEIPFFVQGKFAISRHPETPSGLQH